PHQPPRRRRLGDAAAYAGGDGRPRRRGWFPQARAVDRRVGDLQRLAGGARDGLIDGVETRVQPGADVASARGSGARPDAAAADPSTSAGGAARAGAERPWREAALWLAVLGPFFFLSYGFANWVAAHRAQVGSLVFAWERRIPFIPWTIVPYWTIDAFYAA